MTWVSRSRSVETSPGGTRYPVTPSSTISGRPPSATRDHGGPTGHRLQRDEAEKLGDDDPSSVARPLDGRDDEDGGSAVLPRELLVVDGAEELDPPPDRKRAQERGIVPLRRSRIVTLAADDREPGVGRQGPDEDVDALVGRQAARRTGRRHGVLLDPDGIGADRHPRTGSGSALAEIGADRPSTATPRGCGRTDGGPGHSTLPRRGRGRSRRWRCPGLVRSAPRARSSAHGCDGRARCPRARWPSAAQERLRAPDGRRDSRAVGRCGSSGHHPGASRLPVRTSRAHTRHAVRARVPVRAGTARRRRTGPAVQMQSERRE